MTGRGGVHFVSPKVLMHTSRYEDLELDLRFRRAPHEQEGMREEPSNSAMVITHMMINVTQP